MTPAAERMLHRILAEHTAAGNGKFGRSGEPGAGEAVSGVEPGDPVRIRDIDGAWHDAVAASGVEGTHATDPVTGRERRIHDFPVLWVDTIGVDGKPHRLPWPIEHVTVNPNRRGNR